MKKCLECNLEKELEDFYRHKNGIYYSYCKTCNLKFKQQDTLSLRGLTRKYKISLGVFHSLLKNQNGKCKICNKEIIFETTLPKNKACVDHEKGTLNIRGLLCNNCNVGIGFLDHNIDILLSAINYLKEPITLIGNKNLLHINRRDKKRTNSSGYLGVTKHKKKFRAKLILHGKSIHIGMYKYPEEAAIAYDNFVKLNIPDYENIVTLNNIPDNWVPSSFDIDEDELIASF